MSSQGLQWEVDSEVWFVGPTDDRPYERWLPEAVALVTALFEIGDDETDRLRYVAAILERIGSGTPDPDWLSYRLIRWPVLEETPFVVSYGLVERDPDLAGYLVAKGQPVVEEPIVVESVGRHGSTTRRAVAYYQDGRGLMINLRVIVDFGDAEVVALLDSATRDPKVLAVALDDVDRFAAGLSLERFG